MAYHHCNPKAAPRPRVKGRLFRRRVVHREPAEGTGLALEGSSRRAAARPFCGRRNTALLPYESVGSSATGNLKSGTLPRCGRLKHEKKVIIRRKVK